MEIQTTAVEIQNHENPILVVDLIVLMIVPANVLQLPVLENAPHVMVPVMITVVILAMRIVLKDVVGDVAVIVGMIVFMIVDHRVMMISKHH